MENQTVSLNDFYRSAVTSKIKFKSYFKSVHLENDTEFHKFTTRNITMTSCTTIVAAAAPPPRPCPPLLSPTADAATIAAAPPTAK